MPRCVLHVGMPKTGSTSIQESLYHGLRARGFWYVSFGEVNGERVLLTCFGHDQGEDYHHHRKLGLAKDDLPPLNGTTSRERISVGANQARARDATRKEVHGGADHWEAPRG